jgi:hypothetical protein
MRSFDPLGFRAVLGPSNLKRPARERDEMGSVLPLRAKHW